MTTEEIIYSFKGKIVGSDFMKQAVAETVLKLPPKMIEYLSKNCWFLSSHPESWAYTFNGNDIKNKHFIFLSDELLTQDSDQIQYTILHEIGHIILKHKNSIGFKQTKAETAIQEQQADDFAQKYV